MNDRAIAGKFYQSALPPRVVNMPELNRGKHIVIEPACRDTEARHRGTLTGGSEALYKHSEKTTGW